MKVKKNILNFTNNQNEFKKSDVISNRALLALEDIAKGQGIDISNVISQARETGVGAGRNHIRQSKYYFDGTTMHFNFPKLYASPSKAKAAVENDTNIKTKAVMSAEEEYNTRAFELYEEVMTKYGYVRSDEGN